MPTRARKLKAVFPMPTLAKGTLKIAEKCGVAIVIFENGQRKERV
jgi:hypothetical protein